MEDGAKRYFSFLLGTSDFLPIRLLGVLGAFGGSRGIDRLKSRYLGDRAPITLATLRESSN